MLLTDYQRIARKLEAAENRFDDLSVQITQPDIIADPPTLQKLMREHSTLEEQAAFSRTFRAMLADRETAEEMAQSDDPDMAQMGREELDSLAPRLEEAAQRARLTRTTSAAPSWRYAPARAARRPACSARSWCACTCTTPSRAAGRPS